MDGGTSINASLALTWITDVPSPLNTSRVTIGQSVNSSTAFPLHDEEFHANAHTQAIVYIVIILAMYFTALTVIVVRYVRKERHPPSYLLKKDRSPPSPTATSSFRLGSGRRTAAPDSALTADFVEVTQCLTTVSNQQMMDKQHDHPTSALLLLTNNQMHIDTTSV